MNALALWTPSDPVMVWGVNVLLQVSFVAAVALAIAALLRRNSAVRFWVLCSSLLLILFSPLVAVSLLASGTCLLTVTLTHAPGTTSREVDMPVEAPSDLRLLEGFRRFAQRTADPTVEDELDLRESIASAPHAEARSASESPRPIPTSLPEEKDAATVVLPQTATWIGKTLRVATSPLLLTWFLGAAFLIARLVIGWCRLAVILHSAKPLAHPTFDDAFKQVGLVFQLARMPEFVLSQRISTPIAAGLFRSRVVLPEGMIDRVAPEQLRDVLIHEVAHVVRRDQAIVLLQNLAAALFWLHPLVKLLNRQLAQAREEVCDNYVLSVTDAPSYSRTLLTLAELVQTSAPLPGVAGLFTSRWKLERRIADLLDERRCRTTRPAMRSKVFVVALSLVVTMTAALGTVTLAVGQASDANGTANTPPHESTGAPTSNDSIDTRGLVTTQDGAPTAGATARAVRAQEQATGSPAKAVQPFDWMRGSDHDLEFRLHGEIVDQVGDPVDQPYLKVTLRSSHGDAPLHPTIRGNKFELWVPVNQSRWNSIAIDASSPSSGQSTFELLTRRIIRTAAINGLSLKLQPPSRHTQIHVTHAGGPVSGAHVKAMMWTGREVIGRTDESGKWDCGMLSNEALLGLTAWTDDYRIGGYSFSRGPLRDPTASTHRIELWNARPQTIRIVDQESAPVAGVDFLLQIATGPDVNFVGTIEQSLMQTDDAGEAIFRWFPDLEEVRAPAELRDDQWVLTSGPEWQDDVLVLTVKPKPERKRVMGLCAATANTAGINVEASSFQGEVESRSDVLSTFTDTGGRFWIDVLPDATYCIFANDSKWVSDTIDMVPYQSVPERVRTPKLALSEGQKVTVVLSSDPNSEPIPHQGVNLRSPHKYSWEEGGSVRHGIGGRRLYLFTDDEGQVVANFRPGPLEIGVYAVGWQAEKTIEVEEDGVNIVEIRREAGEPD